MKKQRYHSFVMSNDQIFSSVIRLNTEEAKNKMEDLKKRVQDLVALRDTIDKKKDSGYYKAVSQQIKAAKAELKVYENEVMKTIQTLENLGNASANDIRNAQKSLQKMIDAKPQGAEEMGEFVRRLQEVRQELQSIATMRAFDEVKAGITGTGKSAQQLGAEMRFLRETSENVGTASVQQLEKALEVAREHLKVANQGGKAYERSSEYIRSFNAQLEKVREEQRKTNTLIDRYNKELKEAGKEEKVVADEATLIKRTLDNISGASIRDLEYSIKAVNEQMKDMDRNSDGYKAAEEKVRKLRTELERTRKEAGAQQSVLAKFIKFLNTNWGAFTQIIGLITGLTVTVRKSVKDFADMEEEMADVRKFTGLADEKVRDLNEDFKKIDTRTGRDQLNELAGAAGRLGKQAKKDIMEFVEGSDMINVALGEDLGDGAVEKIGKLAMAFGEDKNKGLKRAMLSTGSAINELVQNSSAQAGYLVDFTARVAGFGKQLGLTQAQIMGFGTVMDENLLKDEMAATAFGNMLTKMQTDTEKFARIAGMNVKEFTDLLNKDANGAVLALADSLKKADPQTMMKMLDDMGLDGSRAVGVLSTLADKIDDVRKHQERATEAYEKATSIQDEFNIKNNTVQAGIEKAKKKFHEVSVALGEKLLPVVRYTITGTSMLIKVTLALIEGFKDYYATIITTSTALGILVLVRQKDIFFTKIQVLWNDKLIKGMRILWQLISKNPYAIAITAIAVVIGLLSDLTRRNQEAAKKTKELTDAQREQKAMAEDMKAVNDEVNRTTAEEMTRFKQLRKTLEDNTKKYEERKKALDEIKKMVPDYHGTLKAENVLIDNNATALDNYVDSLMSAARAQAAFNRMVNLQESSLQHEETLRQRQANQAWARQRLQQAGASEGTTFRTNMGGGYQMYDETGKYVRTVTEAQKEQIEGYQRVIKYNDKRIAQEQTILKTNQKQSETLQKVVEENGGVDGKEAPKGDTTYKSAAEEKKEEEERKKREAEEKQRRKEAEDAAKAASDAKIATLTYEYAMGKIAYRQYIQQMAQLQTEGLENRRDAYEKGSAEYERLNRQVEERIFKGDQQVNRMKLDDLRRCMLQQQAAIEEQAAREEITEEEKNERLRTLDETYLADVVELYREGSLERMQAEWELQDVEQRNKLERERNYQQQLQQVREQYLGMSNERKMQIALNGLDELHRRGLLKEKEYQIARAAIQAQYAGYQTTSERAEKTGSDMLTVARDAAKQKNDGKQGSDAPFIGDIMLYQTTMEKLKELYGNDKENHDAYLAAKRQATAQFCESLASQMQTAYNAVNQVMSAASSYFSAQQEYETAQVQKKYEKQIAAAGNNQKKVKKLQEQQAKEEAAIKSKYNKKQMVIQMAQAVAQTAMNAISAYGAALQIGPAGLTLAPIAAAMAIAAGMLQIAALKKQHEAQAAGYYEGGFTGGKRYRKEAGVVHEGEFVANHQAVNNPNVLPFLNFLDQAQRNNTVGSLTAQDVSRSMGAGGTAQVVAPVVNVQNDNEELSGTLAETRTVLDRLALQLELGIGVDVPIDGENGMYSRMRRFVKLAKIKKPLLE